MSIWQRNLQAGKKGLCGFWSNVALCFLLFTGLLIVATGCQVTQSAFERTAGDAGAAFAAASTTLSYFHQGKISGSYAKASFQNYQSELSGLDAQLPSQQGAIDRQTIAQLLGVYKLAMPVIDQPCLDTSCQWHEQITTLDRASQTFLKAGGQ